MTIDAQITEALCEAQIAIMKQDRLRELNMRSAEIKLGLRKQDMIISAETQRKLVSLNLRSGKK